MSYSAEYKGEKVFLEVGVYGNGQNAIQFMDETGIPYFVATVAVDEHIESDELAIKSYSENEGVLEWMIKNEIVQEPHRFVQSGFVLIPVCKLTEDAKSIFY